MQATVLFALLLFLNAACATERLTEEAGYVQGGVKEDAKSLNAHFASNPMDEMWKLVLIKN